MRSARRLLLTVSLLYFRGFIDAIKKSSDLAVDDIVNKMEKLKIDSMVIKEVRQVVESSNEAKVEYYTLREQLKEKESRIIQREMQWLDLVFSFWLFFHFYLL